MTDLLRDLVRAKVTFQLRAIEAVMRINDRGNSAASKPEADQISTNAETGAAEVTHHVRHSAPVAVHEPKP